MRLSRRPNADSQRRPTSEAASSYPQLFGCGNQVALRTYADRNWGSTVWRRAPLGGQGIRAEAQLGGLGFGHHVARAGSRARLALSAYSRSPAASTVAPSARSSTYTTTARWKNGTWL